MLILIVSVTGYRVLHGNDIAFLPEKVFSALSSLRELYVEIGTFEVFAG